MGVFRGQSALTWVDGESTNNVTQRVLLLREPLRELRYGQRQNVYVADSLDLSQRQTIVVGAGAYELTGRLRYSDNGQTLVDLIKAGTAKQTITYTPDLRDPGVTFACYLISPVVPTVLKMDTDTGTIFGDQEVEIVLRQTNGKPFVAAQQNILLFSFRAGDRLQEGTFTRTGTARYASNASLGGYGVVSTASTNIARLHWMSTKSSQGPRTVPTLLLEGARTNLLKQSENLKASSVWPTGGSLTITSGQADPGGGTKAFKLLDGSTTLAGTIQQTIAITAATRAVVSWFVRSGTGATTSLFRVHTTAGTNKILGKVSWSSGIPLFAAPVGQLIGPAERWGNGFYRQAMRTTGNLTTGNYVVDIVAASATGITVASKGSVIVCKPQVEV